MHIAIITLVSNNNLGLEDMIKLIDDYKKLPCLIIKNW